MPLSYPKGHMQRALYLTGPAAHRTKTVTANGVVVQVASIGVNLAETGTCGHGVVLVGTCNETSKLVK